MNHAVAQEVRLCHGSSFHLLCSEVLGRVWALLADPRKRMKEMFSTISQLFIKRMIKKNKKGLALFKNRLADRINSKMSGLLFV